jgi:hypothetical protein
MSEKEKRNTEIDFFTTGVFELSEAEFFGRLTANGIDTFCDIRRRRGVRGSLYVFANSKRLQAKLKELGIRYIHELGLAPTPDVRELQNEADNKSKKPKRQREELDPLFKRAYNERILDEFDFEAFMEKLQKSGVRKIVLFCIENRPQACHRSLVINRINELYPEITFTHL